MADRTRNYRTEDGIEFGRRTSVCPVDGEPCDTAAACRLIHCARAGGTVKPIPERNLTAAGRYRMTEHERAENLRSLATAISVHRYPDGPYTSARRSEVEAIVERITALPPEAWHRWEDCPPSPADGEIVGTDCLGFLHVATHLVGGGPMWVETWAQVPR